MTCWRINIQPTIHMIVLYIYIIHVFIHFLWSTLLKGIVGSVVRWCPPPFRDMTGITSAPSFGQLTVCRWAQSLRKANSHRLIIDLLVGTTPRLESHRLRRIETSHSCFACQRIMGIILSPVTSKLIHLRELIFDVPCARGSRLARIPLTGLSSWDILTTLRTWMKLKLQQVATAFSHFLRFSEILGRDILWQWNWTVFWRFLPRRV